MTFIKHARLTSDVKFGENNNGNKYAYGGLAYDLYRGKNADGTANYQTTFMNLTTMDERIISFLERFGKKGRLFKFVGEITAGEPYKNKKDEWQSNIRLNLKSVDFPEIRVSNNSNNSSDSNNSGSVNTSNESNSSHAPSDEAEQNGEDLFAQFWGDEEK